MMLAAEKRKSGIALIGDLPWGSHFSQFFQTKNDLLDILIPYYQAGMENNELCIWVTSDFMDRGHALRALKKRIPAFPDYLARGQMEIYPHTDWYLRGGRFDLKRTMGLWKEKYEEALSRGFDGLRVSGNPYWIDNKKDWDDFSSYESEINNAIVGARLLVLCTYSLKKCGVSEILDVLKNHAFALAKNHGAWQVINLSSFAEVYA